MNVGILTLPRADNHGELLQNYGLLKALERLGHVPKTIDFRWRGKTQRRLWERSSLERWGAWGKGILRKILRGGALRDWPDREEWKFITKKLRDFEQHYLPMTHYIGELYSEDQLAQYGFDAYIVGSDQVWRPDYVSDLGTFFLDFLADSSPVKKVAYAACWGGGDWTGSLEDAQRCATLLKRFDAVSVRTAVTAKACRDVLGVEATQVLDPSMLLTREDYLDLMGEHAPAGFSGTILELFYHPTAQKSSIAQRISGLLNKEIRRNMPLPFGRRLPDNLSPCVWPSVESWLQSFQEADFVVTDSFHGMVFALLFEKRFFVLPSVLGGVERFYSLADVCGVRSCLLEADFDGTLRDRLSIDVDYGDVKKRLSEARRSSLEFLDKALR